jgi:hypothetical protein
MRNLAVSLFVSLGFVGLSACSDSGPWSPSDPAKFDRGMFFEDRISTLSADDQAYVMGHAIGVYLMGKTLPEYVADHGYYYRPGKSSPHAEIYYEWEGVMRARSGGSDGNGGVIYDDVGIGGDHGEGDGDENGTNDPFDPGSPGDTPDETGDPTPEDCGIILHDCEGFLDPAASRATDMAALVDATKFAPADLSGADLDRFVGIFENALGDSIVEATRDLDGVSEVTWEKAAAKAAGRCVD